LELRRNEEGMTSTLSNDENRAMRFAPPLLKQGAASLTVSGQCISGRFNHINHY